MKYAAILVIIVAVAIWFVPVGAQPFSTVSKKGPVLVASTMPGCVPCKRDKPIVDKIRKLGIVHVFVLNIKDKKNAKLKAALRIKSVPQYILVDAGKVEWRTNDVDTAFGLIYRMRSRNQKNIACR